MRKKDIKGLAIWKEEIGINIAKGKHTEITDIVILILSDFNNDKANWLYDNFCKNGILSPENFSFAIEFYLSNEDYFKEEL